MDDHLAELLKHGVPPRDTAESDASTSVGEEDEVVPEKKKNKVLEQNAMLTAALRQKTDQLKRMGIMLEALAPLPGVNAERLLNTLDDAAKGDCRDQKILQLAKKVRGLTLALQREKDKRVVVEKEVVKAPDNPPLPPPHREKEFQQLGKLIAELRVQLTRFRDENLSLRKALVKEVGDDKDRVLDEGWRGRAQQIVVLKSRIADLEKTKNTSRAKDDLVAMDNERKRFVEELTTQHAQLTADLKDAKRKLDGFKARTDSLTAECNKGKEHVKLLLEKTDGDNDLIDALRTEIRGLQDDLRLANQHEAGFAKRLHPDRLGQIQVDLTKLRRDNARLELLLERKNLEINTLRSLNHPDRS